MKRFLAGLLLALALPALAQNGSGTGSYGSVGPGGGAGGVPIATNNGTGTFTVNWLYPIFFPNGIGGNGYGLTNLQSTNITGAVYLNAAVSNNTTLILLSNNLAVPTGYQAVYPGSNTVTLSSLSVLSYATNSDTTEVLSGMVRHTYRNPFSVFTGAGWTAALANKTFTNNGVGLGTGGAFVTTSGTGGMVSNNGSMWIVGTFAGLPSVYGSNTFLFAIPGTTLGAGAYGVSGALTASSLWGETNYFWEQIYNNDMYGFWSDGFNVWSNKLYGP